MKRVLNLFEDYMGEIKQMDEELSISAVNTLYRSYNKGCEDEENKKVVFVKDEPKKVNCYVIITKLKDGYRLSAYEDTYSIIGGGGATGTLDDILSLAQGWLKRLNFEKQQYQQLSLF